MRLLHQWEPITFLQHLLLCVLHNDHHVQTVLGLDIEDVTFDYFQDKGSCMLTGVK